MAAEKNIANVLVLAYLLLVPGTVSGFQDIAGNIDLFCQENLKIKQLHCNYRLINPEKVLEITANTGDISLPVTNLDNYPWEKAITAILILVDTSDPGRENVITENKHDIKQILTSVKNFHRIGLASFDKTLRLEAKIGSSNELILNSLEKLHAVGKTTELYRSVLSAIYLLDKFESNRKIIYLFSDGLAEDKAYYHDDVVNAAKKAGVVITSLGYPRSVNQSVGLQTIRRLSEETGGLFIESDNNFQINDTELKNLFSVIDNGARFNIDVSKLSGLTSGTDINIKLVIKTGSDQYLTQIPFSFPESEIAIPQAVRQNSATETAPTTRAIQIVTKEPSGKSLNPWFWYGIPAFLLFLLIITLVVSVVIIYRQGKKRPPSDSKIAEFKPYAYLVMQDESKKRYPITRTTWRIGRGKDNEMTLKDSSVSRRHAEIHRGKGDIFTLYDLESMNGVYVNNNKVSKIILHEGDILEIGDIVFRFTLLSTEYTLEESTVMQNTRAPITH